MVAEQYNVSFTARRIHAFNGTTILAGNWSGDRGRYSPVPNKMDYPFKNYWFWVVLVLVVGSSFFYITFNLPASSKLRGEPTSHSGDSARLTIKFNANDVRSFEGPVVKNMTALQALLSASRGGGFDVRYSLEKDGGVNLASIGSSFNGAKSWHFYLNGKLIKAGELDKTRIKKGDLIEARYE